MPINQMSMQLTSIIMALAGAERIFELTDEEPEADEGYVTLTRIKFRKGAAEHELLEQIPASYVEETEERDGIWAWKHPHETGETTYTRLTGDVRFFDVDFGYEEGKTVLHNVTLYAKPGQKIAFVGATGAGKTTILHTISGLVPAKSGSITFNGTELTKTPAHKIVSMGMAHVPEGRRIFQELTVYENLMLGAFTRKDKAEIENTLEEVFKRFPRLEERRTQIAGTLSGGEQQMLAMGRALMSHPSIILMDEPSMGLSPLYVSEIFDIIQSVNESGTTVLLVEQNAKKALSVANRAYVLETGKIVLSGDAHELMNNDSVKKAYLGE